LILESLLVGKISSNFKSLLDKIGLIKKRGLKLGKNYSKSERF